MNEMTPADYKAITGNDGFGSGGGAWWIIILFIFAMFGWGGRGAYGGASGVADNYVLASDFATIQRQLSDGFSGVDRKLDAQNSGICELGYTQAQLINNLGMNVMQTGNAIQTQLADCCCKTQTGQAQINYNLATQANMVDRSIERGFCQTNYNNQTQHNETMQGIDRAADRVIEWLANDKQQTLRDENQALRLSMSQQAQNNAIISALRPLPIPAYPSCNPWAANYNPCQCNGTWG